MESNRKIVSIHCTKTGIHIDGANDIGSTSDGVVSCKRHFLRVCAVWWNTYCGSDEEDELPRNCDEWPCVLTPDCVCHPNIGRKRKAEEGGAE